MAGNASPESLGPDRRRQLLAPLAAVDARLAATRGHTTPLQPPHTCYVPADRLRKNEAWLWGDEALVLLHDHAPDNAALAGILDLHLPERTYDDVVRILRTQPVADLRVDLEDGYGIRVDEIEDGEVARCVALLAEAPPPSYGVRVKSLESHTAERSLRTLDLWLTALHQSGLGPGIITLPKVSAPEQVTVVVEALTQIEAALGSDRAALELQVESAEGVVDSAGRVTVPLLIAAGRGRVTGLHFGTYDFTAALGVSPQDQRIDAPIADAAKDLLQLAAAGTGVAVSDGSSNVLPVGDRVHDAWRTHARLVDRALTRGLWQGWDLHPGQLVSRWAATSAFLRTRLPEVTARLSSDRPHISEEPATRAMLESLVRRASSLGIDS
ncbi:aldolase/citrate lyase family protein [Acidothermaceae bacterium B102]|nr:aldolase/citrate lyase family protein [Acidothermaceae bacterium B102]